MFNESDIAKNGNAKDVAILLKNPDGEEVSNANKHAIANNVDLVNRTWESSEKLTN